MINKTAQQLIDEVQYSSEDYLSLIALGRFSHPCGRKCFNKSKFSKDTQQ